MVAVVVGVLAVGVVVTVVTDSVVALTVAVAVQ